MNVNRFVAATNQKALALVHEAYGSDALIYSTRSTETGIEILAGPPFEEKPVLKSEQFDFSIVDKLQQQLQIMSQTIENLSSQVNKHAVAELDYTDDEQVLKRNLLNFHLSKMGFRGKFAQQFTYNYLRSRKLAEAINEENISTSLLKYIKTNALEIADEHSVCTFVGPTGVGKTTTIMKLAKRFLGNNAVSSLGLITTDYNDISSRHQLLNFSRLYKIDLEFANHEDELSLVLESMKNKKLILIDTHGISQRDHQMVSNLLELIESQGAKIAVYMVLPCNVQEPILDEIARAFQTRHLKGCILTKQDESISVAPALSISILYKLYIAYICNGQNIEKDLSLAKADEILSHIISETSKRKKVTEENLIKNVERVSRRTIPELRLG